MVQLNLHKNRDRKNVIQGYKMSHICLNWEEYRVRQPNQKMPTLSHDIHQSNYRLPAIKPAAFVCRYREKWKICSINFTFNIFSLQVGVQRLNISRIVCTKCVNGLALKFVFNSLHGQEMHQSHICGRPKKVQVILKSWSITLHFMYARCLICGN